ncbi:uncharacterized membrane protein YgdD (TMEM256/DUF423 family) [Lewinella marina]|uniref:DUF423 domain-containing protein n=1 Tax=Neolewinella marina TaxID=438751 RepID=A0A2G0CI23_9BACT|nr:DUF423 domain-containing protein [Neolewinella marina]NJB85314.1 uncharacterized membrane protein YgdD (TMEM256/DUF423 family) [Neolewinella marina]PHK99570.1 hypothetical protein CGL56_00500 [Neolewinella marina]
MNQTQLIRLTALLGASAVVLGAFGAHGLRQLVGPDQLAVYETGVRYQFYHSFAIGLAALLRGKAGVRPGRITLAVLLWAVGLLLFSGSLYALSLREVHGWPVAFLGPITPLGGLLLIGGWIALLLSPQKS